MCIRDRAYSVYLSRIPYSMVWCLDLRSWDTSYLVIWYPSWVPTQDVVWGIISTGLWHTVYTMYVGPTSPCTSSVYALSVVVSHTLDMASSGYLLQYHDIMVWTCDLRSWDTSYLESGIPILSTYPGQDIDVVLEVLYICCVWASHPIDTSGTDTVPR